MRKILALSAIGVVGLVGVAQAKKPHPTHPTKPYTLKSCKVRSEGYNARGTLVSSALATTVGDADGFTGPITVDVAWANHHALRGTQTIMLTDAHIAFGNGVSTTAPAVGTRVGLHGKITVLPRGCDTTGFTQTITVKRVDLRVATP